MEIPVKFKKFFDIPGSPSSYLPSGSLLVDFCVSGGRGWPLGGIVELAGEPDSGKTSLGLLAIASAIAQRGEGFVINTERDLSRDYLSAMGCNGTPVAQAPVGSKLYLEEILAIIDATVDARINIEERTPFVILWDSGANSSSKEEVPIATLSKKESKPAVRASHISEWLRQGIVTKLNQQNILVIIVNHLKSTFTPKWLGQALESPLGRSLKYLCLSRNTLEQKGVIGNPPEGIIIQLRNISGKQPKAYRTVRFPFYPDFRRVDNRASVIDYLVSAEILPKDSNGRIVWDDKKIFPSNLKEIVGSDKIVWEKLKNLLVENW